MEGKAQGAYITTAGCRETGSCRSRGIQLKIRIKKLKKSGPSTMVKENLSQLWAIPAPSWGFVHFLSKVIMFFAGFTGNTPGKPICTEFQSLLSMGLNEWLNHVT